MRFGIPCRPIRGTTTRIVSDFAILVNRKKSNQKTLSAEMLRVLIFFKKSVKICMIYWQKKVFFGFL